MMPIKEKPTPVTNKQLRMSLVLRLPKKETSTTPKIKRETPAIEFLIMTILRQPRLINLGTKTAPEIVPTAVGITTNPAKETGKPMISAVIWGILMVTTDKIICIIIIKMRG